uniref:Gamma-tubulin complex component n=1 Tax=Gongylonema pulchrum TaxID=637853 RepID=A0A183DWK8_9BILA
LIEMISVRFSLMRTVVHPKSMKQTRFVLYNERHAVREQRQAKLAVAETSSGSVVSFASSDRQCVVTFAPTPSTSTSKKDSLRSLSLYSPSTPVRFIGRVAEECVVSDEELLRNVLLALQGSEGHYFVHQSNCEHRKLCLSNAFHLDNIYRSCLLQLLTIANAYLFLQYECKKPKSDMLIRAFDTGLSEVLDRYLAKVVSFYTQVSKECKFSVPSSKFTGTAFVTFLTLSVTADSFESENLSILLQPMLYILHECLATWLLKGKLSDFEFEWMIEKVADQWYENSWKDEYRIVSTSIPAVLELSEKIVEKILFIGKTVNLLSTLGLENDCRDEMKRIFSSVDSSKCYLDILHFDELRCAVDKLLVCAKDLIARKIIKKYGVLEHIRTVQELYLLGDECFAHIFYGKLKILHIGFVADFSSIPVSSGRVLLLAARNNGIYEN